jgi:galactokinase
VAGAAEILKRFRQLYPDSPTPRIWRAPGRVNLIGEHTDYNLGLVLPMAIELECLVATAPAPHDSLRVFSEQLAAAAQWRVVDVPCATPRRAWDDRILGVAWELARRGIPIAPQDILIDATIPLGAGLSSSAALGVAMTLALGGPRDPLEVSQIAQAAETDFVGLPCGIMDQFASTHGQAGSAILLDCRSLEWRPVKLSEDLAVVTANSMIRHELGDSAYRTRVAECAEAARALGVASLRDAALFQLDSLSGTSLKRARHIVTENLRVEAFVAAAGRGDALEMGRLISASHRSLRDDYDVSCPELDFLVETALTVPGVLGARIMGGGFGGSTVNLVRRRAVDSLKEALESKYRCSYGRTPEIHPCVASERASQLFP